MRKRFIGLLLLLLLAMPTFAAEPEALTALASYFPADTVIFAAVRTDDDHIDAVDALLQRVGQVIPEAAPPVSLGFMLNVAAMENLGVSFEEGVRSWLGDTAAFGLLSIDELTAGDDAPGVLLAVEITNRTAALEFLENVLSDVSDLEKSRVQGYHVFSSAFRSGAVAVNDDVMLVSNNLDNLALHGDFARLSANEDFSAGLATLPEPDYNALLYLNTPVLQAANREMMRQTGGELPLFELSSSVAGVTVLGFTVLDGRSLTIDAVSPINLDNLAAFGLEPNIPDPVDPAFAQRVPADAPFVLLGSGLGRSFEVMFNNLRRLDAVVEENGGWELFFGPSINARTRANLQNFTVRGALGAVNLSFAGFTGLSLENDFLPMLDGNFALFLRVLEDETGMLIPDVGFVSEVSDPELAFANVAQLQASLEAYGSPYSVETVAEDANVIAAQWLRSLLQTSSPNVDVLIGTDGRSFVIGTRRAVLDARNSLSHDPSYLAAQAYFLPDTSQIGYFGGRALVGLVDKLIASYPPSTREISDLPELRALLTGVESISITSSFVSNESALARFVLTLAELPPRSGGAASVDAVPEDMSAPPGALPTPTSTSP